MAEVIAAQEGITLAVEHWEVVRFVRGFTLNLTPLGDPYAGQGDGQQVWRREGNSRYLCSPVKVARAKAGEVHLIEDREFVPAAGGLMGLG